uniref:Uncharacterized protein n=1 Tax=Kalanchoe fedtschenkoi TaxID=63787 RepID=A0A7N1A746_KALFE
MQSLLMTIQGSRNKGSLDRDGINDNKDSNSRSSGGGLIVSWSKFLPFRSLKVLVVESDDSTRHVVGALLKNCGYEVMAVANGLQAWKVLEDRGNHIDIVLTEVVLPFLTGLGLLRKIMNHETRKNLPVIMMSPSDSLGVVYKCLSNGATDFLVKPIRKNELRTLWQHVWRKSHSSSGGSVAESDTVTRFKAHVKSSGFGKSCSNSNNGDDNISDQGLNCKNGSDQGSGTQASQDNRNTKRDPPTASSSGHLSDPDNADVTPPMHNWDLNYSVGELKGYNIGDATIGRDLEIGVPGNPVTKLKPPREKEPETKGCSRQNSGQENNSKDDAHSEKRLFELNEQPSEKEVINRDAHLTATSAKNPRQKVADVGESNGLGNVNHLIPNDECFFRAGSKQNEVRKGNGGKAARQRNVLGHSSNSAFARYGSASKANKGQSRNVGSCSPVEGGSEAAAEEQPLPKHQDNHGGGPPDNSSDDNSKNYDKGINAVSKELVGCTDKKLNPNTKSSHPISVQPVKRTHTRGEPSVNASLKGATPAQRDLDQHIQLQHHYHPYHHHHYQAQNMQQQQLEGLNHADSSMKDVTIMDPQLQPPAVLLAPITGSAFQNFMNGTPPGRNVGCFGHNSCSAADNTAGMNPMADTGTVHGFISGVSSNRQLQRLAALHKFRQKRKDRCFGKKVRYESRKILAEQRPRMKGQFVRRAAISNTGGVHFC